VGRRATSSSRAEPTDVEEDMDCRSDHDGRTVVGVAVVDDMPRTVADDAVVLVHVLVVDGLVHVAGSGGLRKRKRLAPPAVSAVRGGN